jgi:SAM-dependent methyltransferase
VTAHVDEDALRHAELDTLRPRFPLSGRVLEVGAGSGLQAATITSWGLDVAAVDLPARDRVATHHTVVEYDGVRLPFAPGTFDVVFSSNVLEHVRDLPSLLDETRRVLAPNGFALHVLPTPTWRVATSLTHPLTALRKLARGQREVAVGGHADATTSRRPMTLLRRGLFSGPHGEFPSATAEIRGFSSHRWTARFSEAGWKLQDRFALGVFYTGETIWPSLPIAWRRRLAVVFGAATAAYVVTPGR